MSQVINNSELLCFNVFMTVMIVMPCHDIMMYQSNIHTLYIWLKYVKTLSVCNFELNLTD